MHRGFWLGDVYVVDYPDLIMPQYDEEKAKAITEAAKKCGEELRKIMKENDVKILINDKEF